MKLVFMLEEPSMKEVLKVILPKIVPENVHCLYIVHEGKDDLKKSLPRKLKAWREPEVQFIVMRDNDSADCKQVKAELVDICRNCNKPDTLIRIVCQELESWFLADLVAVERALNVNGLARKQGQITYRDPDSKPNAAQLLKNLVPDYQKVSGARAIAPELDLTNTRSNSFKVLIDGIKRLI